MIVDTTVWVDYLRGVQNPETDWLNVEVDRQRLGLTDLILCEVLQGIRERLPSSIKFFIVRSFGNSMLPLNDAKISASGRLGLRGAGIRTAFSTPRQVIPTRCPRPA